MQEYKQIDENSSGDDKKIFDLLHMTCMTTYENMSKEIMGFVEANQDLFAVPPKVASFELIFTCFVNLIANFIQKGFDSHEVGMARTFQRIEDTLKLSEEK